MRTVSFLATALALSRIRRGPVFVARDSSAPRRQVSDAARRARAGARARLRGLLQVTATAVRRCRAWRGVAQPTLCGLQTPLSHSRPVAQAGVQAAGAGVAAGAAAPSCGLQIPSSHSSPEAHTVEQVVAAASSSCGLQTPSVALLVRGAGGGARGRVLDLDLDGAETVLDGLEDAASRALIG
jgi:hypothetical protein